MTKLNSFYFTVLIGLIFICSCKNDKTTQNDSNAKEKTKVGFITVGPVTDWGYNYSHNEAKIYMDNHGSDEFETQIIEKVPESAEVERVMERMIANGTKLIFPTSYGYLEPALRVAKKHKDVVFMHCGGFKISENLGTYFAYIHEPMYLSGMAAGRMTKTNKLGFVASFPIPQVLRNINAFTLGARATNPEIKVHVIWTSNWYDPATEAEATKNLVSIGADVVTCHQDSPLTVVQTAEKEGIMSVGYHADLKKWAPNGWITGAKWNWGELYLDMAKAVKNGAWKSEQIRKGMNSGYVGLSEFGENVPDEIQQEVMAMQARIISGEYEVFQGPLYDRDGTLTLEEGTEITFEWMEKNELFC